MSGDISKIVSVYLNQSGFDQAVKEINGQSKCINNKDSRYTVYHVEAGSSTLRKMGFVVGMVLTGFIPFIVLNLLSRSFHEYFFGKVVKVIIDPLKTFSGVLTDQERALGLGLSILKPAGWSAIEKWRGSKAAQQYRSELTADNQEAIEKALRDRQAEKKANAPKDASVPFNDYVYVTGPAPTTTACTSDTITFNLYYTQVAVSNGKVHQLTVFLNGKGMYSASGEKGDASAATLEGLVNDLVPDGIQGVEIRLC